MKLIVPFALALLGIPAITGVAEAQYANDPRYETRGFRDRDPWRDELAMQAHRFSEDSLYLAQFARSVGAHPHVVQDRRELARSAEAFHRNVEAGAPVTSLSAALPELGRDAQHFVEALSVALARGGLEPDRDVQRLDRSFARLRDLVMRAQQQASFDPRGPAYDRYGYDPRFRQRRFPRAPRRWELRFGF
jgi:hypothetical protein